MNNVSTTIQHSTTVHQPSITAETKNVPPIPGALDSAIGVPVRTAQDVARLGVAVKSLVWRPNSIAGMIFRNYESFGYISAIGDGINGIVNAGKGLADRSWTLVKKGVGQLANGAVTGALAWNIRKIVGAVAENVLHVAPETYLEVPAKIFMGLSGATLIGKGLYNRVSGKSTDESGRIITGSLLLLQGLWGLDKSSLEANRAARYEASHATCLPNDQCAANFNHQRWLY